MLPVRFKPFLKRFPEFNNEFIDKLSNKSAKLQALPKLLDTKLADNPIKKAVIMVSYVYTGEIIKKYF